MESPKSNKPYVFTCKYCVEDLRVFILLFLIHVFIYVCKCTHSLVEEKKNVFIFQKIPLLIYNVLTMNKLLMCLFIEYRSEKKLNIWPRDPIAIMLPNTRHINKNFQQKSNTTYRQINIISRKILLPNRIIKIHDRSWNFSRIK